MGIFDAEIKQRKNAFDCDDMIRKSPETFTKYEHTIHRTQQLLIATASVVVTGTSCNQASGD